MYFCYLDESGTPELGANTTHFVLLGFAIPADMWADKDHRINRIKQKFGLSNKEIHTGYLARQFPEQKKVSDFEGLDFPARTQAVQKVREQELIKTAGLKSDKKLKELKKKYRMTADYIHLSHAQRTDLLSQVADEIGGWGDCRLFAEAIDKNHFVGTAGMYNQAFEQVVTRFHTFLAIRENEREKRGHAEFLRNYGVLIQDNNDTVKTHLTGLMREFHRTGTVWSKIPQIVETPLFVDSSLTSMIQIADLCAYATRRYFENQEDDLFNRILSRFDRKGGRLVGIRHFTSKHCKCRVCFSH
ncbi:MAG TPA: DUF3800 domain-containing protein [Verrucomicrobiae bacterium]